jgi:hypothetical protein
LILGFDFYRLKPVYPTFGGFGIYQFFGVFQRDSVARINLNTTKNGKFINCNSFLDSEGFVFGIDRTGKNLISLINRAS